MNTLQLVFVALISVTCVAGAGGGAGLQLTQPTVDVDTKYTVYYNATLGRNITSFEVYRINSVLAYGLPGDNGASPGGEIGFITNQYGSTSGYIMKYCVEVMLPVGTGLADLNNGSSPAFSPYSCCNGGSCSYCGYDGSGTDYTTTDGVGRSWNLDTPSFANGMSATYGYWYSFPEGGVCSDGSPMGQNGCSYKVSPYVNVVKLDDLVNLNGWTSSPADYTEFLAINSIMVNAYDTKLMKSYTYSAKNNKYTPVAGQVTPDPTDRCAVRCSLGSYSPTGLVAMGSGCTPCALGTYASQVGQTSCHACPIGQTTNAAGATSVLACFNPITAVCNAGTYNEYTGHIPCKPCPPDTYQPHHSSQSCLDCPSYTTTNGTVGATMSSACVLQPPSAMMVYAYSPLASNPGLIADAIVADNMGEIGYLQASYYGQTLSASGTVSYRCVETVDAPFFDNNCWYSYCSTTGNTANLPLNGTAAQTATSWQYINNKWVLPDPGQWYTFPKAGECNNSQLPGQGQCTWKSSTLALTANLGQLMQQGLYSCELASPYGYCYGQALTQSQLDNSTHVLSTLGNNATLLSTVATPGSNPVVGPVSIKNGKCYVDCPAGYTFRSAFTAPYCVPVSVVAPPTTTATQAGTTTTAAVQNTTSTLFAVQSTTSEFDVEAVVPEVSSSSSSTTSSSPSASSVYQDLVYQGKSGLSAGAIAGIVVAVLVAVVGVGAFLYRRLTSQRRNMERLRDQVQFL